MAFRASPSEVLSRLEQAVTSHLEDGWVAEPHAARLALLIRDELRTWTQATYPGSTCEGAALDPDSRRRLSLTIFSAPVTHRVEVWGMACGDAVEATPPETGHASHSWVVLAHHGEPCRNLEARAATLQSAGLKRLDAREGLRLSLSLWMGAAAPDGCPACLGKS